MKMLIVTNHYINLISGGSIGTCSSVNIFTEIVPECYLIYPESEEDPGKYINNKVNLIPCIDPFPKWLKGFLVYFGRLHRFTKIVKNFLEKENIDLVVFDTCIASHNLIKYVKAKVKIIFTIHHGVEKDFYKDNKPNPLIRIPFMIYLAMAERRAIVMSDMNLVPTLLDKKKLLTRYKELIHQNRIQIFSVYENKETEIEKLYRNSSDKKINSEITFIITGSLSFPQSDICIRNFLEEYIPVIRQTISHFKVIIAGKNPTEKLIKTAESFYEVMIIKNPVNMADVIKDADIYICPVNMGSGIKLRIMDGLKTGLPVITHKESINGYESFVERKYIFTYDSPATFLVSLELLLKSNINPAEIIQLYEDSFSFAAGKKKMESILSDFISFK